MADTILSVTRNEMSGNTNELLWLAAVIFAAAALICILAAKFL